MWQKMESYLHEKFNIQALNNNNTVDKIKLTVETNFSLSGIQM